MFEFRYGNFSLTIIGWIGVLALILILAMFVLGGHTSPRLP